MKYAMTGLLLSGVFTTLIAARSADEPRVDSIVYDTGISWQVYAKGNQIQAFAVDGQDVWYATADKVCILNLKTGKVEEFQKVGSAAAAGATSILVEQPGVVWIATPEGAAVRRKGVWSNYGEGTGLPGNSVNALLCTGGAVWAGTDNGAALYKDGSWTAYTTAQGLCGNKVRAFAVDGNGAVWIGTDKGISVADKGSFKNHTMKTGLSWNDTRALGYDPREKIMWAAVGEQDVNSWDGKSWKVYMGIHEGILSIMADTQSRIWFGSMTGLLKFNGDEWISDPAKLSIPAVQVPDMYKDAGGNLWYASENGIIYLKNPYPY